MTSFSMTGAAVASTASSSLSSSAVSGASQEPLAHCLAIQAQAEPGLLERIVGHLSKRGLVPSRLVSSVDGDYFFLDLQVTGLVDREASHLAQRLRGLPAVDSVLLCIRNGEPAE